MRRIVLIASFQCFFTMFPAVAQPVLWSDESARTISRSRFEMGLLHTPARYGLTDDLELSTYPLFDVFVPGISAKKVWQTTDEYLLASSHSLYSPTPFLRFVAREKTGGLLPPDNYVPFFLVVDSYIILSRPFAEGHTATARVGVRAAVALGDRTADRMPYERLQTIDYPFIFPRTAFLTKTPTLAPDVTLALTGPLVWDLGYSADCRVFLFWMHDNLRAEDKTCWAVEPSAIVFWNVSDHFSWHLGIIYSVGSYPFGHNSVLYPLLDVRFGFGGPEANER